MTSNYTKLKLMAPGDLATWMANAGLCPDMLLSPDEMDKQRCKGPGGALGMTPEAVCRDCILTWLHEAAADQKEGDS